VIDGLVDMGCEYGLVSSGLVTMKLLVIST